MDKRSIRELDASGKRSSSLRLRQGWAGQGRHPHPGLSTIKYLLDQGARVILASHLGRPDGKVQDGLRLRPVAERAFALVPRPMHG